MKVKHLIRELLKCDPDLPVTGANGEHTFMVYIGGEDGDNCVVIDDSDVPYCNLDDTPLPEKEDRI